MIGKQCDLLLIAFFQEMQIQCACRNNRGSLYLFRCKPDGKTELVVQYFGEGAEKFFTADTFPESGTIEGTVEGRWSRVTDFTSDTRELYFHFTAEYLGDNTARIELNNGDVFIVHLETGDVEEELVE